MRVVLDANVLVLALISTAGPSRAVITARVDERFELIASPTLLAELQDVLDRPRFRRWVGTANELVAGLREDAEIIEDPPPVTAITPDRDDDYPVALAPAAHADSLVCGDRRLLGLADPAPPVLTPREFLDLLEA